MCQRQQQRRQFTVSSGELLAALITGSSVRLQPFFAAAADCRELGPDTEQVHGQASKAAVHPTTDVQARRLYSSGSTPTQTCCEAAASEEGVERGRTASGGVSGGDRIGGERAANRTQDTETVARW